MENCIFCQIIAGKSPAHKVYEDNDFLAFLDIFPRARGHLLVIPKKHYRWVYDVLQFGPYWEVVLKLTQAVKKAINPDFISYITYGVDVPHAHVHIVPQKEEKMIWPVVKKYSSDELESIAAQIREKI